MPDQWAETAQEVRDCLWRLHAFNLTKAMRAQLSNKPVNRICIQLSIACGSF